MTGIDSDKLWWRRLVLIVDQATSSEMMQQREKVLHDQLPQILERYGMTHTPAVMFVSSSGKQYAEYTLQCKQVLRQLIDSNHRLGRWRPDEDEDDFLDAAVIHLTPQGKMPVRSMTRYNK
ncbi:hypothetical protein BDB00DRAFT_830850 [Zychaea mexicana]|uniref:uncharacterized protein n=1 Tax=Zychaea mexicana TaxID=64656 RepID=UPI0022FEA08D|nr:uncharacterized protein BDB00DRAFT_830850 [Zychaea mexicana]KAI9491835.1 hypothetical protein BDB00DRAFT_830850 [Zychaea mexicana]